MNFLAFQKAHTWMQKHPKRIAGVCLFLILGSFCEIYCYTLYGYAQLHEGFQVDWTTLWSNRPGTVVTRKTETGETLTYAFNAQGFRRRTIAEIIPKKKTTLRIITLGDSTTNGQGVAFDSMYAERLNQMFGKRVEVFSSGVAGFSAVQCYIQLKRKILDYHPDLITVCVSFNDRRSVFDPSMIDDEQSFHSQARIRSVVEFLSRHVAMVNTFCQIRLESMQERLESHPPPLDELLCRVPEETYRMHLNRICTLARQKGMKVVFIGLGDSFQVFDGIYAFHNATTFEDKMNALIQERKDEHYHTYGLATLLLADLLRAHPEQKTSLDPNELLTHYNTVVSALGGFVIKPEWTYRSIMKQVANENHIPYLDFVEHALQINDIRTGKTPIHIKNDPIHLNVRGHKLLAETLYPLLEEELAK